MRAPRFDSAHAAAAHTVSLVKVAQSRSPHRSPAGHFRKGHAIGRKVPRQAHPLAIEAEYAAAILGVLKPVFAALREIHAAAPDMVTAARVSRGDSATAIRFDSLDATETLRPLRVVVFAGLPIVIENERGSTRYWTDSNGTQGSTLMLYDYGYIPGVMGADNEGVDVYRGPDPDSQWVHVVHQNTPDPASPARSELRKKAGAMYGVEPPPLEREWTYDEDKVMLGFASADDARAAYLAQYNDPRFFGGMSTMSLEDFKAKLVDLDGKKIAHYDSWRFDAAETGRAKLLFDRARRALHDATSVGRLDTLATKYAKATSDFQRAQLAKQVKAVLRIDLVAADPKVPAMIEHFAHYNAKLITSLGEKAVGDVEKIVTRAFTTGERPETVASDIADRFGITERHARFIARDQIGSLTGQVNAARQKEIGVTRFNWRTAGDERVRDEHVDLGDGGPYDYDDPPSEGLPGEPVNCRCSAEPVLEDILEAAAEE